MTNRRRQCYYIPPDQFDPGRGYVPSLVTEGEAGHQPLRGNGRFAQPWYWGMDYDTARRICAERNRDDFGLSEDDAALIVASSVSGSRR